MSGRQIIFDTETTGFNHDVDDRITELGCVEVIDFIPTGKELRILVNPERDIPAEVTKVTGHTWEMLKDERKFAEVADEFLEFVGEAELVAHNAGFDMAFINMELKRCGRRAIDPARFIDTAAMARQKFPGAPASLDALCKRFDISLDSRTKHGALIDAYLLAEVYLELNGGREQGLGFITRAGETASVEYKTRKARPAPLPSRVTDEERAAHAAFIGEMNDPLWKALGLVEARAAK
ncbi:MAG: DNA polymerase III subunit epsilon [Oceanicaulis sp.]